MPAHPVQMKFLSYVFNPGQLVVGLWEVGVTAGGTPVVTVCGWLSLFPVTALRRPWSRRL